MICTAAHWVSGAMGGVSVNTRTGVLFSLPQGHSEALSPQLATDEAGKSWISQAYGGVILFEDLTPNLGLWWYAHTLSVHAWEWKQLETHSLRQKYI